MSSKFSLGNGRGTQFYLPLLIIFVILVLLMPKAAKFDYDYKKGMPWQYETLVSQFDFPILKTNEQIEEERERNGTSVIPYFRYSDEIVNTTLKSLEGLDFGAYSYLKAPVVTRVSRIYQRGIISDGRIRLDRGSAAVSDELLFIQKNKRAEKYPRSEVYKVSDARDKLVADLVVQYPSVNVDSVLNKSGVYGLLVPNLVFDKATTELVHAESADYISPTQGQFNADQKIVSKGEIVTADIAQILDSYRVEYERNLGYDGPRILLWIGDMLLALAIVLILALSIQYSNPRIFYRRRFRYLLTVFTITAFVTLVVERINPSFLYLVPFTVVTLYLSAFFEDRVVLPVYTACLLPLLIFSNRGAELFVMYLSAGVVSMFLFRIYWRGWQQFVTAALVFLTLVLVYSGFRLIDATSSNYVRTLLFLFGSSLLTVACYPLVYLFEKIFNLVSQTRLQELADTNNPALRELSKKAPGTFQHCLQVMSMSDAVARAIGANVPLVRAGALYHDLGKMNNPLCFIENETSVGEGHHYHDGLTYVQSAREIIRHVSDGMELADKYKLPDMVKEFIRTHHGTSATTYFLNKYLNDGGDPSATADFYYHGVRPSTREQVVVMLCDSIEAASRSVREGGPEAYNRLVDSIIDGKLKDGQLSNADISIRDIEQIRAVLKSYLNQIYHERVAYPKRKDAPADPSLSDNNK